MDAEAAKFLGAGLTALGMIGAGIGVGNVWATLIASVARNPAAADNVTTFAFIGFAVTEAIALFALVLGLLILFA